MSFLTSKLDAIKVEKIKLIEQNRQLYSSVEEKKRYYEALEDKIADIEDLIEHGREGSNVDDLKLLKTISQAQKKAIVDAIPSGYPSRARRVTSKFGYRIHPIDGVKKFHHGMDFGGAIGTPIVATADGMVEFSGFNRGGYGNLVVLSHNFGFKTAYGHMQDRLPYKAGDFVKKGEIIGYLGNSGKSTGPHLHYEIKFVKRVLNPEDFIALGDDSFDALVLRQKKVNWKSVSNAVLYHLSSNAF